MLNTFLTRLTLLYIVPVLIVLIFVYWFVSFAQSSTESDLRSLYSYEYGVLAIQRERLEAELSAVGERLLKLASSADEKLLEERMHEFLAPYQLDECRLRQYENGKKEPTKDYPENGSLDISHLNPEQSNPASFFESNFLARGAYRVQWIKPAPDFQEGMLRFAARSSTRPDSVFVAWLPITALVHQLAIKGSLPESYTFLVLDPQSKAENDSPRLLWHSSLAFTGSESTRIQVQTTEFCREFVLSKSSDEPYYMTTKNPSNDMFSGRQDIVIRSVPILLAGDQKNSVILGFGIPYGVATQRQNSLRNLARVLSTACVGIFLVGALMLITQWWLLRAEARKEQAVKLHELQQNYQQLFAQIPTAILVFDDHGTLIDCNQGAEKIAGRPLARDKNLAWSDLFRESAQQESVFDTLVRKGQLAPREVKLLRTIDKSALLIEVEGRQIGEQWILAMHDVEAKRDLEQQKARFKKMDSMGSLVSTIAHDFNNLLGEVQILVSHARSEVDHDPESSLFHDLALIEDRIDDASRMVKNMLTLKESAILDRAAALEPVLHEYVAAQSRVMPENVKFIAEVGSNLPKAWIAPHSLRRILNNLIKNALDAMPSGGRLSIRAYARRIETQFGDDQLPPDDYAVIEVSDDGVGMSPELLENVFEPFFSTKGESKGTGLGLWNVYQIVRQLGGWLNVTSKPKLGTTVTIFLRNAPPPVRQGPG